MSLCLPSPEPPQLASLRRWAPVEQTRCAHGQADDVRRFPKQLGLISVRHDALVSRATIDVRHDCVEVVLPIHPVCIMEPITDVFERCNLLCLEQLVSGSARVVILASTKPTGALDRAAERRSSPAPDIDCAGPVSVRNVGDGVRQISMPVGNLFRWQDSTDDICTNVQLPCSWLHACVVEHIHNTLVAIASQKVSKEAYHRKARAITTRSGSRYSGQSDHNPTKWITILPGQVWSQTYYSVYFFLCCIQSGLKLAVPQYEQEMTQLDTYVL